MVKKLSEYFIKNNWKKKKNQKQFRLEKVIKKRDMLKITIIH